MTDPTVGLQADLDALLRALESAMPAFDRAMARTGGAAAASTGGGACVGAGGDAGPGADAALAPIARAGDAAEHAPDDRGAADAGSSAGAGAGAGSDALFERLSDAGAVRVLQAGARLRRRLDAMLARLADEVATRSGPEFGAEGLAKQHGFHTPTKLVAATLGGSTAEAARLLAVGVATRSRRSFAGEPLPPKHPYARAALDAGMLSIDAAALITGMFGRVARRADPHLLEPYEATLVDLARSAPISLVVRAVRLAESRLDPDGVEPADEILREARSLTLHEEASGMFRMRGLLDPVTAAPIKAALDALVGDVLRRREPRAGCDAAGEAPGVDATGVDATGFDAAAVIEDERSIPQIQADALAQLAQHALGCVDAPTPLITTTVVVRMSLDALATGIGSAEVDGVDRPISASSARRLAADAALIPAVLGRESVPLDLGRTTRLFTRAQRLALTERDGGCASCGQNVTYAQAHHIEWWVRDRGPTDLDNGVMLCSFCHHQVHRDGWGIRIDQSRVWFIPPPHIDPEQRPRIGGRARFDPSVRATSSDARRQDHQPLRLTHPTHPARPARPARVPA